MVEKEGNKDEKGDKKNNNENNKIKINWECYKNTGDY